jgi:hypothetical protein
LIAADITDSSTARRTSPKARCESTDSLPTLAFRLLVEVPLRKGRERFLQLEFSSRVEFLFFEPMEFVNPFPATYPGERRSQKLGGLYSLASMTPGTT